MVTLAALSPTETLPGSTRLGLKRRLGSTSQAIIRGEGLTGMSVKVVLKDRPGRQPFWTGPLTENLIPGNWNVTLVCYLSTTVDEDLGTHDGDRDPEDVPVTVTAGTDLSNPQATNNSITVPVG